MVRWRKLKFEKVIYSVESDPYKTKSICDTYLQEMMTEYCLNRDLLFKNLIINGSKDCSVKILCNKDELRDLSMDLIIHESRYIKNIIY